ncbi:MAG: nucleoside triphosphate pyrophosphohydrolase [Bacteroidetes bacterium]|nr:nucleoside triphosphate pyrophosphohydrolase [Bacteroidota bacterium]MBS1685600.1 nucleoside triphosphate pyrophosphohydrolase [Bacteroidota bacterium]
MDEKLKAFGRILQIMNELREQCPWDKKQTLESLRPLTIEETYELSDAIIKKDLTLLKEELGDLLLHIVFYARIGEEQGAFDMASVINDLCDKLIRRHPHIYGDVKVENEEDVKQNWEKIKMKEGRKSVMGGVPESLPALIKAWRVQDKARQVGFEWDNIEDVWRKVEEETQELHEVVKEGNADRIEDEFGDLMFALVNYSRFLNVDPETALERTNQKFLKRFRYIEEVAAGQGRALTDMTLGEMDAIWNVAKGKG